MKFICRNVENNMPEPPMTTANHNHPSSTTNGTTTHHHHQWNCPPSNDHQQHHLQNTTTNETPPHLAPLTTAHLQRLQTSNNRAPPTTSKVLPQLKTNNSPPLLFHIYHPSHIYSSPSEHCTNLCLYRWNLMHENLMWRKYLQLHGTGCYGT